MIKWLIQLNKINPRHVHILLITQVVLSSDMQTKQTFAHIPLQRYELTHFIWPRSNFCDWNGASMLRKSYMCTDAPTAITISNPETDIESTSDPRCAKRIFFTIRVSQDNIFLSIPAVITWPTGTNGNFYLAVVSRNKVRDWLIYAEMVPLGLGVKNAYYETCHNDHNTITHKHLLDYP